MCWWLGGPGVANFFSLAAVNRESGGHGAANFFSLAAVSTLNREWLVQSLL